MTQFVAGGASPASISALTIPMSPVAFAGRSTGSGTSIEAMRHQTAAVIQRSYRWLEATVPVAPQVTALIPQLITAVQQYEAEQYAVSLSGAASVVHTAQALHDSAPMLPKP